MGKNKPRPVGHCSNSNIKLLYNILYYNIHNGTKSRTVATNHSMSFIFDPGASYYYDDIQL